MTTIQQIFKDYSPEYLERFSPKVPANHIKVINAVLFCRTQDNGMVLYACKKCGKIHSVFRSCGNRHCPACQNHKSRDWLDNQCKRQLPGHHFMITFTVPDTIRGMIRSNQRLCYNAMFKASSYAVKRLCPDPKYIGGDTPGFFGVLHTWGRKLQYHPHIHYIVPGGAYCSRSKLWQPSRQDYFLPVKALAKLFKTRFLSLMKKAGLLRRIPYEARTREWNVNCHQAGTGIEVTKYLSPYVFKVAISNTRISRVENRVVSFRYKKVKSRRWRTCSLDVMEFIRRFLQHVLPTGFMKVRYYGFLHPGCSIGLAQIGAAIEAAVKINAVIVKITTARYDPTCPDCGGELEYLYSVLPYMIPPKEPD